jgi:hypothetical protein
VAKSTPSYKEISARADQPGIISHALHIMLSKVQMLPALCLAMATTGLARSINDEAQIKKLVVFGDSVSNRKIHPICLEVHSPL